MTPEEKVRAALSAWCEETDPAPTGLDLSSWVRIIQKWSPEPINIDEVNRVGRKHWGDVWYDIVPHPVREPF